MLSDPALGQFALGAAGVAGAFLAISSAVWIFIFDRKLGIEAEALKEATSAGKALYDFVKAHAASENSSSNYLSKLDSYGGFAHLITRLALTDAIDKVPSWQVWRIKADSIYRRTNEVEGELAFADFDAAMGVPSSGAFTDQATREFHTRFVELRCIVRVVW